MPKFTLSKEVKYGVHREQVVVEQEVVQEQVYQVLVQDDLGFVLRVIVDISELCVNRL